MTLQEWTRMGLGHFACAVNSCSSEYLYRCLSVTLSVGPSASLYVCLCSYPSTYLCILLVLWGSLLHTQNHTRPILDHRPQTLMDPYINMLYYTRRCLYT